MNICVLFHNKNNQFLKPWWKDLNFGKILNFSKYKQFKQNKRLKIAAIDMFPTFSVHQRSWCRKEIQWFF